VFVSKTLFLSYILVNGSNLIGDGFSLYDYYMFVLIYFECDFNIDALLDSLSGVLFKSC
jgi:hypothetical protein